MEKKRELLETKGRAKQIMEELEAKGFTITFSKSGEIEMESWTDGGVDMLFYIDFEKAIEYENSFEVLLKDYIENFYIDDEIDLHRQDSRYRNDFTIKESVKDFTEYKEKLKKIAYQNYTPKKIIVYSVFECNQWRNNDSMRFINAFTNTKLLLEKLKENYEEEISDAVKDGRIDNADLVTIDDFIKQRIAYVHIITSNLNEWEE